MERFDQATPFYFVRTFGLPDGMGWDGTVKDITRGGDRKEGRSGINGANLCEMKDLRGSLNNKCLKIYK
jgi:hypothetical protein